MGLGDNLIAGELKKTNDRLDRLIVEQQRTNQLLALLAGVEPTAPSPELDPNGPNGAHRHSRLGRR